MSDESGQPVAVGQAADALPPPTPPSAPPAYAPPAPPVYAPPTPASYGAPAPPLPPPGSTYDSPRRKRPVRTVGGIIGVLVVIGLKLLAVVGVGHFLHGASPFVIIVVLIVVSILFRPLLRRFLGR